MRGKGWTVEDTRMLMANINEMTVDELVELLDINYQTLCMKIAQVDKKYGPLIDFPEDEKAQATEILHTFYMTRADLKVKNLESHEVELICRAFPHLTGEKVRDIFDKVLKSTCRLCEGRRKSSFKYDRNVGNADNFYSGSLCRSAI